MTKKETKATYLEDLVDAVWKELSHNERKEVLEEWGIVFEENKEAGEWIAHDQYKK